MISAGFDRICIVMMSALGDAVHVLPVIRALKRHHPKAHITWVLQRVPAMLVRGHPDVDEIIEFDRTRGWRGFWEIRNHLASRPFDLVLALQVYIKAGIITSFTKAPVKLGFDRARARDANTLFTTHQIAPHPTGQHVQDQYFEFLEALGVPFQPVEWNIGPWPQERAAQKAFLASCERTPVAIAFSSSEREREWPVERWAKVCALLWERYDLQPVLVGGTSEREQAFERDLRGLVPRVPVRSTLGASFREMVGVLDASALAIAVNSGAMHIAVAVNRPVVSLLGYRNPKRTGPYRFPDLRLDAYGNPGEDYPYSFDVRPGQMHRIAVDDVARKLEHWAAHYGPTWGR